MNTMIKDQENFSQTNSPNFQSSYILCIPSHVADDAQLNNNEIVLFAQLSRLADSYGYLDESNKCLASTLGVTINTLKIYLKNLEDLGYIKREVKKIFDPQKKAIQTKRRIYVMCDFTHPISDKNDDGKKRIFTNKKKALTRM